MRITESQLRKIVKRMINETRSYVLPGEIEAAFEELYSESGEVTLEDLASFLGMAEADLRKQIPGTRLSCDPVTHTITGG